MRQALLLILFTGAAATATAFAQPVTNIRVRTDRARADQGIADDPDAGALRPPRAARRVGRLVAADGGTLTVSRSRDQQTLWVVRGYDDGTTLLLRFALEGETTSNLTLLYVDGEGLEPESVEAWVLDTSTGHAWRPARPREVLRVVPLGPRASPNTTAWAIRVPHCDEAGGAACIYVGSAHSLCRQFAELSAEDAARFDFAPRGC